MKTPPNQTAFESAPSKRNYTPQVPCPESLYTMCAPEWSAPGFLDSEVPA